MKKILLLSLAYCMLAITGCSKDEEPNYAEPYIGKWVQTAYKASSGAFIGQEDGTYIQFNADGTFIFFLGGVFNETTTGMYKMTSGISMELNISGETSKPTIDFYDVEGNTATVQFLFFNTGTYKMEKRSSNSEPEDDFTTSSKAGVSQWKAEDYTFNRYYTLIETFGEAAFLPEIMVKAPDEVPITVSWQVKGATLPNVELTKYWDAAIQLWQYTFIPKPQEALTFGEKVVVNVSFAGKDYRREATVQESKITREILWVNFGMTKEEVQKSVPSYSEFGPNTWVSPAVHIPNGNALFRFQSGKLTEVGEYGLMTQAQLCELCYSLGLAETIEIVNNELSKEYVWNNGKIEFRLCKIENVPAVGTSNINTYYGIMYRKL